MLKNGKFFDKILVSWKQNEMTKMASAQLQVRTLTGYFSGIFWLQAGSWWGWGGRTALRVSFYLHYTRITHSCMIIRPLCTSQLKYKTPIGSNWCMKGAELKQLCHKKTHSSWAPCKQYAYVVHASKNSCTAYVFRSRRGAVRGTGWE